jgi:hypothetical protein
LKRKLTYFEMLGSSFALYKQELKHDEKCPKATSQQGTRRETIAQ